MSFEKPPSPQQEDPSSENKKKGNRRIKKSASNGPENPGRRKFLKGAAAAAGAAAVSGPLGRLLEDESKQQENKADSREKESSEEINGQVQAVVEQIQEQATPEQEKIEQENITSLSEILDFEKEGRVELDTETMEAIKNHWKERYKQDPDLRNSLKEGYKNIGEWEPYLREQFQRVGIPEKYVYLSLPESHWQIEARSSAGAVGPYQFTAKTARRYGLKTNYFADQPPNLDERKDPIKAAEACAHHLKDSYESSGSWDLSLAGYNGGYFWYYLKESYKQGKDISYSGFLAYLEDKLNDIKEEIKSKDYEEYKIERGDTMEDIASKFNMEEEELCHINNIKNKNRIFAGQALNIPVAENTKKKIFEKKIKGMEENLNYPPKFNAIYELIQEDLEVDQEEPISFDTTKVGKGYKSYTFKKEDKNIYRVSQKFPGVSPKEIIEANPHINPKRLGGGEKLHIPTPEAEPTLSAIAEQQRKGLDRLTKLNPAIEDPGKPTPKGYNIRV